ncbi:tubulin-specific chaperone C [Engraulis encrasicolus]|uniref:tubulin-specific chaperone C n=1 Tax=Engraulis encrasicolus TaxID=184585 RepID=UPI002FD4DCDD
MWYIQAVRPMNQLEIVLLYCYSLYFLLWPFTIYHNATMSLDVNAGLCVDKNDLNPNETLKIPDRLLKRDQARLEEVERRKDIKESSSVAEENSGFFLTTFNTERESIEVLLSTCNGANREDASKVLEEATIKTQQLQKFLNDSMVFLTPFNLRQAQAALQALQTSLSEQRDAVLPKKKFAFKSRNVKSKTTVSPSSSVTEIPKADKDRDTVVDTAPIQCAFSSAESQVLIKTAVEIQQRDVLLSHLTNCKVRLLGSPSTLHIKHVRDCEILCGPVSSSVFVDQCSGSTLAFPCQQLRTHNTKDTRIYLHVTSRAIIEDCQGVSFAPFTWTYSNLDADFAVSGLDRNRNNWDQVDDFNWLAAGTPSPNWTVIPENDRKTSWDELLPASA